MNQHDIENLQEHYRTDGTTKLDLTLADFLDHSDPTIKRNAMSIYKRLEKIKETTWQEKEFKLYKDCDQYGCNPKEGHYCVPF